MPYKVLYRKYRPNSFEDIIGEKTIVDNLKESIINKTFSHAYIFTGPRGTGKTSTAKVLAKTINCTNTQKGEACGKCETCLNFSTSPDIIEIDAASNNGVSEIRELRTNITLAPSSSKYKIYIIDEVHMLSSGAFNALLKTLEEPPSHAIFILATTEVYKVPITILSRCQRYDFKKHNKDELINHLKNICKKEKINYEEPALDEIYELSEGCARDSLSILDQLSKSKEKITQETVLKEYNIISNKTIDELLRSTLNSDCQNIINTITDFENSGMEAQKLIKKIINYLENIAIDIKLKKEKTYDFTFISNIIKNLSQHYIDARFNKNIFTLIKITFLELTNNSEVPINKPSPKEIKKGIQNPESTVTVAAPTSLRDIRINNCFVNASKNDLNKITEVWSNIKNKKIDSLLLKDFDPVAASDKNAIFACEDDSLTNLFNIKHEEIEKLLNKENISVKIVALTNEEWAKEKNKYKINIQSKKKYEYIEEPKHKSEQETIKEQIEDLFTEELIEIN